MLLTYKNTNKSNMWNTFVAFFNNFINNRKAIF